MSEMKCRLFSIKALKNVQIFFEYDQLIKISGWKKYCKSSITMQ